ncbi:MFS transporter [Alkalibacter rhizosphaerae]|uniref:MFS transporter n=1 Tax=Alkalibacter rhizosphaerae TaxID=2815577 RepID=A0A975AHN2_9FIRM|nr:MFS transporter [Alkalibacter rhizosphaerae]QSX07660.1 MFS transporter [Alkalibacter rhizosphaerae]
MEKKSIYSLKSIRYGVTNGFSTLLTTVASTFWAIFLTSAVGLETAVMATVLTIGSLADLISIPIVGVVMQKTKFKKGGKYRPWLVIGGVGAALLRWLSFTDIGLTGMGRAIWFAGTYILTYLLFNFAYTAFTGLLPLMAKDPRERVAFSSARVMLNSVGKFLFSLTSVALISAFSGGGEGSSFGYSMFALLIAVLVSFGFIQLFFASKEYDVIESISDEKRIGKMKDQYDATIWEMLKSSITKPYLLYLISAVAKACIFFSIMGLAAYYYNYVVGDMSKLTLFLSLSTFLMIIGSFITPFVNKVLKGGRNTYIFGVSIFGICLALAYFLGNTAMSFTVLLALGYFGYSFAHASEVAIFTMIADYNEWKSGKNVKPFMMSLFSLTPKIATTVGAAIVGFGLVGIGFDAENVTADAISGIRILISLLPAVFAAISAIALVFFPLTDQKVTQLQNEMEEKKQATQIKKEEIV